MIKFVVTKRVYNEKILRYNDNNTNNINYVKELIVIINLLVIITIKDIDILNVWLKYF